MQFCARRQLPILHIDGRRGDAKLPLPSRLPVRSEKARRILKYPDECRLTGPTIPCSSRKLRFDMTLRGDGVLFMRRALPDGKRVVVLASSRCGRWLEWPELRSGDPA